MINNFVSSNSALDGLDELSIENLFCKRITKDCIHEAVRRVRKNYNIDINDIGRGSGANYCDMLVAEELNDMLYAADLKFKKCE